MCVPGLSSLSQWEWMSMHLLAQVWCLLNEFDLGSEAKDGWVDGFSELLYIHPLLWNVSPLSTLVTHIAIT